MLLLIAFSTSSFANETVFNQEESAYHMKSILLQALGESPLFSGIDLTGCDTTTGKKSLAEGSELCVRLYFRSLEAVLSAQVLYPEGQKVNGTFIIVEYLNPGPR